MSPTKPVRRLPECERQAQLSSLLEEDELDLRHQVAESTNGDYNQSLCVFTSDTNSSNEDSVIPQHAASVHASTLPSMSSQRPPFTLDLLSDDWVGHAPLATPETLSETSSFGSMVSLQRQCSQHGARVKVEFAKLETIEQSPLRHGSGDDCLVKLLSPVGDSPKPIGDPVQEPLAHSTPARVDRMDSPSSGFDATAWPTPIRIPVLLGAAAPLHCGTAVNSCPGDEMLFNDASRTDIDIASGPTTNGHDQTPPVKCNAPLGNGLLSRPAEGGTASVCPDSSCADKTHFVSNTKRLKAMQSFQGCRWEKKQSTPDKGRLRRTHSDGPRAAKKIHALHNGGANTGATPCNGSGGARHSEGDVAWGCDGTKCSWPVVTGSGGEQSDTG